MECPHAARCPGCALIALPYDVQLERKRSLVTRALGAYPELAHANVLATVPAAAASNYRVRAKLVASGGALGLFERGSHRVVDIPECPVLRPRLRSVAAALRGRLREIGKVTSIDLRETDAGVIVTLAVPEGVSELERERMVQVAALAAPEIAIVALSRRDPDDPRVLGAAPEVMHGPTELRHTLEAGAPFHYASPGAFTQAHAEQASVLHRAVERVLREEFRSETANGVAALRVLELYAGSGALGLRLARAGAELTLVENFAPAVELSRRAAAEQALALRAVARDAELGLKDLTDAGERFDAVIVNPPRRGISPGVRRGVAAVKPALLVYVSCDPVTLARDAAHLAVLGYALESATPLDMIPLSDAVETLAIFRPAPCPEPSVRHDAGSFTIIERRAHEGPGAASGLALVPSPELPRSAEPVRFEYLALVRGVIRARGSFSRKTEPGAKIGATLRYERREVAGGHSLIALFSEGACEPTLFARLAGVGHPVLGDAHHGDARSNAHFEHRHGLDRPFLHVTGLRFREDGQDVALSSRLAPDLERVLANLSARARALAPRTAPR